MRKACLDSIYKLAKQDPRVVFIGSDLSPGLLSEMRQEMPDRWFMEGVAEQNVVGMAAGMTQAETLKTSKIINALKGKHTLLVVEHDMAFVREIAQRITVMHLGQVLAEGSVTEIEQNPKVKEAYLGSRAIS